MWLNDVQSLCNPNAVIQLIGNKLDLIAKREISAAEAESFAERHQMNYLEASAKGGDNINEAFVRAATAILKKGLASASGSEPKPMMANVPVMATPAEPPKGNCAC
jgi:GTPase SAR1 family protein